jgi:hypothetical protein
MIRRFISSCVLAGFIVAQWAALPHAHALVSELIGDHDKTPHVHMETFGRSTRDCFPAKSSAATGWLACDCPLCCVADHDGHAIYLPAFSTMASAAGKHPCTMLQAPTVLQCWPCMTLDSVQSHLNLQAAIPVRSFSARAIYLALCALRI